MSKDTTTIQVTRKLHEKLVSLGKKGDTFEDILWGLIEKVEGKKEGVRLGKTA
jgi:predicted CopG family antitoxin